MNRIPDLLYPRHCPVCDRLLGDGELLICRDCTQHTELIREPVCLRCGRPLSGGSRIRIPEYCADCQKREHRFVRGFAPYIYRGEIQASILRMKYEGRAEYARFYAASIFRFGGSLVRRWDPDVIVPVPVHWKRELKRGYNQAEEIAGAFSELTGIPVSSPAIRIRQTRAQKGLTPAGRRKNVRGAFALRKGAEPAAKILLVDDIYTTGSTLDELSSVLLEGGARQIWFACASVSPADV